MNLTKEVKNLETNCNEIDCDPVIIFDFNFDVEYEFVCLLKNSLL